MPDQIAELIEKQNRIEGPHYVTEVKTYDDYPAGEDRYETKHTSFKAFLDEFVEDQSWGSYTLENLEGDEALVFLDGNDGQQFYLELKWCTYPQIEVIKV